MWRAGIIPCKNSFSEEIEIDVKHTVSYNFKQWRWVIQHKIYVKEFLDDEYYDIVELYNIINRYIVGDTYVSF